MGSNDDKLKDEVLLAVAISLGSLFFATVITLIVARYYKQIRACCTRCFSGEDPDNNSTNNNQSRDDVTYSKMSEAKGAFSAFPYLTPMFTIPGDSRKNLLVPGGFFSQAIQPELKQNRFASTEDGFSPRGADSRSGSPSSTYSARRSTSSSISLPAKFSPYASKRKIKFRQDSHVFSSDDEENAAQNAETGQFMSFQDMTMLSTFDPKMYDIKRQRTVGAGELGKIELSVQYENNSRKKLILSLNRIRKLQLRPDISGIYASVVLLPEREVIYTTKQHRVTPNPNFEERFIFSSRPMNRDFQSKTVLFLIHFTDRLSKDIIYGEARMPLLCREIYSQVTTDVTLNIKAASMQSEFGDLLVQLIYDEGTLTVTFKMIKVPSSMSLENMAALRIKSYVKKSTTRIGRKNISITTLRDHNQYLIQLDGESSFKVTKEVFMACDLTCSVIGKHKILGKKLHLGKVIIGQNSRDETGIVHWKTVSSSPGVAWSVWHPIYST